MTVYLIHFDAPLGDPANPRGQAQHYIGFTDDIAARLDAHRRGLGAALMAAVSRMGIGWQVVLTWEGGRDLERKLKRRKKARRLCPVCRGRQNIDGGTQMVKKTEEPKIGEDWLTTEDAARLSGYSQAYMRQLAQRKRVPALKAGRDWLLNREALLEYTRGMEAMGNEKHNPWKVDREDLAQSGRGRE